MLKTETVGEDLYTLLNELFQITYIKENFRLVGGTSLALQIGHRVSDDIDLFTDRSFNVSLLREELTDKFENIRFVAIQQHGISLNINNIKVDIYNWNTPFIKPSIKAGNISLCSMDDIAAFKLDAITTRKTKKDYIDIAFLCKQFSFTQMIDFYKKKYPYSNPVVVLREIDNTEGIESSPAPRMIKKMSIDQAYEIIQAAINGYKKELMDSKRQADAKREEKIIDLIKRKKK